MEESYIPVKRPYKFITTTSCQRVIHEDVNSSEGFGNIIIQSDLTHPKLFPTLTGHVMNGRVLCPSGLYADMALTCADYLYKTICPTAAPAGYNVCAIEVHKPLIVDKTPSVDGVHIQIEARADMESSEMTLTIRSVTWDGKTLLEHSQGLVKYEDPEEWQRIWASQNYLVKGQIDQLHSYYEQGSANKFLRGIAYRLFSQLVSYGPKYQGMSSVIKTDTAAVAKINFQASQGLDGDFMCSPYYIDNLCHLSGFIVNAQDDIDSPTPLTYISHGWESLKFLKPRDFTSEKEYTSFVKMVDQGKNVMAGDVYILDGEEIVAVLYGLKFQGIPQRLMDVLIPPIKTKKSSMVNGSRIGKEKKKVKVSSEVVASA